MNSCTWIEPNPGAILTVKMVRLNNEIDHSVAFCSKFPLIFSPELRKPLFIKINWIAIQPLLWTITSILNWMFYICIMTLRITATQCNSVLASGENWWSNSDLTVSLSRITTITLYTTLKADVSISCDQEWNYHHLQKLLRLSTPLDSKFFKFCNSWTF